MKPRYSYAVIYSGLAGYQTCELRVYGRTPGKPIVCGGAGNGTQYSVVPEENKIFSKTVGVDRSCCRDVGRSLSEGKWYTLQFRKVKGSHHIYSRCKRCD